MSLPLEHNSFQSHSKKIAKSEKCVEIATGVLNIHKNRLIYDIQFNPFMYF